jgi:hypothetical protein
MICPECGKTANCESVHNGVRWLFGPWFCGYCGWSEDDGFPMTQQDWNNKFAEEDDALGRP